MNEVKKKKEPQKLVNDKGDIITMYPDGSADIWIKGSKETHSVKNVNQLNDFLEALYGIPDDEEKPETGKEKGGHEEKGPISTDRFDEIRDILKTFGFHEAVYNGEGYWFLFKDITSTAIYINLFDKAKLDYPSGAKEEFESIDKFMDWLPKHFKTGEQLISDLEHLFSSHGILTPAGGIHPYKKGWAIKDIRQYIHSYCGMDVGLANAKAAMENYKIFVDYVKANGLPNMEKTSDGLQQIIAKAVASKPEVDPTKIGGVKTTPSDDPNSLSLNEMDELASLIIYFPGWEGFSQFGKQYFIRGQDTLNIKFMIDKVSGTYRVSDATTGVWAVAKELWDFQGVYDYVRGQLKSTLSDTSKEEDVVEALTNGEIKLISDVVKKYYPAIYSVKRKKFYGPQGTTPYVSMEIKKTKKDSYAFAKDATGDYTMYKVIDNTWDIVFRSAKFEEVYDKFHEMLSGKSVSNTGSLTQEQRDWIEAYIAANKPDFEVRQWTDGTVGVYDPTVKKPDDLYKPGKALFIVSKMPSTQYTIRYFVLPD